MVSTIYRWLSIVSIILSVFLVVLDMLVIHDPSLDGFGIVSTFVLPPLGIIFAAISFQQTASNKDIALIVLNLLIFLSFFMYMFFGTLFFGV
ncbi:hypothetical protein PAALTS15_19193 [Paenibacillus alvei TS-15]|uniref:Uncharacterized protein n=1 Tax=Paenibacillus alvei TS-15 TaxID=1117108 RepID=S9U5D6_PAEAL|nr:hypothetical protein [Paenibacillus alvei]EPY05685.1 hypothetical protein PAALTS15_19193 [Paenibacillus alvei TS-15]